MSRAEVRTTRCRCCGERFLSPDRQKVTCAMCLTECTNEGCVVANWERLP